jgi:replicative superfamily II helicase
MTDPARRGVDVEELLRELGAERFVEDARQTATTRELAAGPDLTLSQPQPERLARYGYVYELKAIAAYEAAAAQDDGEKLAVEARRAFGMAFECWSALSSLPIGNEDLRQGAVSESGLAVLRRELNEEIIPADLALAVRIAVAGLGADFTTETRLALNGFELPERVDEALPWRDQVARHVASALVRLVRKAGGWKDVLAAVDDVAQLRRLQEQYEGQYLEALEDKAEQTLAALELVGLYHLAQIVTVVGEYLRTGGDSIAQVRSRIDRHRERARTSLLAGQRATVAHLADLIWVAARKLAQNAIWTHMSGLGERVKEFGKLLASQGRPQPVLELWPSQQEALQRNLLDPYKRAILVEMPTSAGKTLLAEFAAVQSKVLYPDGCIAYIVPTRALVNQITIQLRDDLKLIGLKVEQTVPAIEIDPTEAKLLGGAPDVLVTTPEKLDLLLRRGHPVTQHIALVIADEAHNLRDGDRGARLELLLAMLKRDRADARFLLLSPFLPNGQELVTWLGDDRALDPIRVNWKPSRRVVGAVDVKGSGRSRRLVFETLPAAAGVDVPEGRIVTIGPGPERRTIKSLTKATVSAWADRGAVLVLCEGPGTAATRAKELASDLKELPKTVEREAVCHYLEAEVGRTPPLVNWIRRGVAYHHAGLSQEARWLIEGLIRRNQVRIVCGTTTLAQGVNFPITTVVVETLQKGTARLSYEDFWNIAGRAGRALVDSLGVVAFPAPSDAKRQEFVQFLRGEAREISSQLATLVERADEIVAQGFGTNAVFNSPALGSFMQFLAHAMRVAGGTDIAENVEDLLRASLVYRQAQKTGPDAPQALVRLCRAYLAQVREQKHIVALADQTGFTTPSVLLLRAMTQDRKDLAVPENWSPALLFGRDVAPLTDRVATIAQLPEIRLSTGTRPPFNPHRVASILRDWVNGETLASLTKNYSLSREGDSDQQLAEFSRYLFSELLVRASWGLGALEIVTLAGTESPAREEAAYVPSMVYFGVRKKEAVWLRMVGVPRVAADGLADMWKQSMTREPESYDDIRTWVGKLSDDQWQRAAPRGSPLNASDLRIVWQEFAG